MPEINIRRPALAGHFYPATKQELEGTVGAYLAGVSPRSPEGPLRALIVPHAGYVASGVVAAQAYKLLEGCESAFREVILLGPSHYVNATRVVTDANDYWETPLGRVRVLESELPKHPAAHAREHCLEVQLPFLQHTIGEMAILPLVVGDADLYETSKLLMPLLEEGSRLLVVSSDLSHFHDYETAREIDERTCRAVSNLDRESMRREGQACGKIPILALLEIANRRRWKCKLLDYKNSGDTIGDRRRVVGYASFCFT